MTFGRLMLACAVAWTAVACSGNVILSSPDGNIKVEHALSEEGVSVLRVSAYGEGVMEISAAGLVAEEAGLCTGFEIADIDRSSVDMIWTQPWGENKSVIDRHREMAVSLKNDDGVSLVLRVRAGKAGEAGSIFEYEAALDSAFAMYESLGVHVLKTG